MKGDTNRYGAIFCGLSFILCFLGFETASTEVTLLHLFLKQDHYLLALICFSTAAWACFKACLADILSLLIVLGNVFFNR